MGKGREPVAQLVRRMRRGYEQDPVQLELPCSRLGGPEVPDVNRIEGSAEKHSLHGWVNLKIRKQV